MLSQSWTARPPRPPFATVRPPFAFRPSSPIRPPFLPSLASSVPVSPHEPAGADTVNIGILTSISTFDSRPRLSIGHALPAHAGKDLVGGELLELVVVEPHHRLVRKDYPAAVSPPRPRAPSPPAWSG